MVTAQKLLDLHNLNKVKITSEYYLSSKPFISALLYLCTKNKSKLKFQKTTIYNVSHYSIYTEFTEYCSTKHHYNSGEYKIQVSKC